MGNPPVACAVFFKFLYPLFSNVEFYYEKTGFVMVASCIGAVANIILNYIFIPIFGYLAAGYTTLFCYILYSFAHYVFQRKVLRDVGIEQPIFDLKYILLFSSVILVIMVLLLFLYRNYWIRYGAALVLGIVFIVVIRKNKGILKK